MKDVNTCDDVRVIFYSPVKQVNYLHSKTKALHKKIKPEILRHEIVTSYHQLPPNDL